MSPDINCLQESSAPLPWSCTLSILWSNSFQPTSKSSESHFTQLLLLSYNLAEEVMTKGTFIFLKKVLFFQDRPLPKPLVSVTCAPHHTLPLQGCLSQPSMAFTSKTVFLIKFYFPHDKILAQQRLWQTPGGQSLCCATCYLPGPHSWHLKHHLSYRLGPRVVAV